MRHLAFALTLTLMGLACIEAHNNKRPDDAVSLMNLHSKPHEQAQVSTAADSLPSKPPRSHRHKAHMTHSMGVRRPSRAQQKELQVTLLGRVHKMDVAGADSEVPMSQVTPDSNVHSQPGPGAEQEQLEPNAASNLAGAGQQTYDQEGYGTDGYDENGFDRAGYDRQGYNRLGYDRNGLQKEGYDEEGYDMYGYDQQGYDHTGYDAEGYDRYGCDEEGYDRDGNKRGEWAGDRNGQYGARADDEDEQEDRRREHRQHERAGDKDERAEYDSYEVRRVRVQADRSMFERI